ncbi:MAG TPA: response regulator [Geothrix sp.]|nr:response regulator [Geothrix sp.]
MTGLLHRMTFRQQLLSLLLGGLGLTLILSFILALSYARGTLRQNLLKDCRAQAQVLTESLAADLDFGTLLSGSKSTKAFLSNPEIIAVEVRDKEGRPFAREARTGAQPEFAKILGDQEGYVFSDGYLDVASEIRYEGQKKGLLYLRASLDQIQTQFQKAVWALSLQSVALLLLIFLLGSRVLRGISGPVLELTEMARKVSTTHNYSLRMPPGQGGEVGIMANSFNDMLERIQQQDKRLSEQIQLLDQELRERRRIESELRVNEERLAMALESAGEGVWDWSVQEHLVRYNARWSQILGMERAPLEQGEKEFLSRLHEEDVPLVMDRLQCCVEGADDLQVTHRMHKANGSLIWVETRGKAVERDSDGKALRIVGRTVDVTEMREAETQKKELERELLHLQRMESVGRLAGGVAHDMNNVLGAIMAVGSILEEQHPTDPAMLKNVRIILGAAERGRNLVKGLLEFARKDLQAAAPLDLNELVRKEVELLRSTSLKEFEIDLNLQDPLPSIMGEANALSNVLMNLCVNAMDAMPRGGRLCLMTLTPAPGLVELVVEDNGQGMTPEVRQRALEPFFTTKPSGKGTGLGLSMVFGTVKAHGGTLEIESEPGKGTRVRIQFLANGGARPLTQRLEPTTQASQERPHRLLLVDDDPFIQETVSTMLESMGHQVQVAKDGQEGLDRLQSGPLPDLVILDMNMPGISGLETLRQLRHRYPDLPVIFGSGFMSPQVQQALAEFHWVQPLAKPYTRQEIQDAMRAAVEMPPPPRT